MDKNILKTIEDVTGLKFGKKPISVILGDESRSSPLTVKVEDPDDMIDNLIHELIHVIFTRNYKGKFKKKWNSLMDTYVGFNKLNPVTARHIPVHAVHYLVTKKIRPHRIKNIKSYSEHPDYIKSWKIVEKIGAKKILDSLK